MGKYYVKSELLPQQDTYTYGSRIMCLCSVTTQSKELKGLKLFAEQQKGFMLYLCFSINYWFQFLFFDAEHIVTNIRRKTQK